MAKVKVKKGDLVTVYGTGKSKFLAKDAKVKLHTVAADKLIASGKATKTAAKSA